MRTAFPKALVYNALFLLLCRILFSAEYVAWMLAALKHNWWAFILLCCLVAAIGIAGNYLIFRRKKPKKMPAQKATVVPKEYIRTLLRYYFKNELGKQVNSAVSQIQRLRAKENGLLLLLEQNFDKKEITYTKYRESIEEACNLFYQNTRALTNAVVLFDEKEYRALRAGTLQLAPVMHSAKVRYYEEQFRRMNAILFKNEEIITTLDNLLLAITDLNNSARSESEKKQILEELRLLSANAARYNT